MLTTLIWHFLGNKDDIFSNAQVERDKFATPGILQMTKLEGMPDIWNLSLRSKVVLALFPGSPERKISRSRAEEPGNEASPTLYYI